MNDEVSFRNLDVLLKVKEGEFELGEFLLRHWNAHLPIAILDPTASADKRVKPGFDGLTDDGM